MNENGDADGMDGWMGGRGGGDMMMMSESDRRNE
jgi:hypothetical protein